MYFIITHSVARCAEVVDWTGETEEAKILKFVNEEFQKWHDKGSAMAKRFGGIWESPYLDENGKIIPILTMAGLTGEYTANGGEEKFMVATI